MLQARVVYPLFEQFRVVLHPDHHPAFKCLVVLKVDVLRTRDGVRLDSASL